MAAIRVTRLLPQARPHPHRERCLASESPAPPWPRPAVATASRLSTARTVESPETPVPLHRGVGTKRKAGRDHVRSQIRVLLGPLTTTPWSWRGVHRCPGGHGSQRRGWGRKGLPGSGSQGSQRCLSALVHLQRRQYRVARPLVGQWGEFRVPGLVPFPTVHLLTPLSPFCAPPSPPPPPLHPSISTLVSSSQCPSPLHHANTCQAFLCLFGWLASPSTPTPGPWSQGPAMQKCPAVHDSPAGLSCITGQPSRR